MFKIDPNSKIPLYQQVEQFLRELITQDAYQQGKFLPKEVELANDLGISRNTIRQATNKLVEEGLLHRKKGVGTTVKKGQVTTKLREWHSFTQEMNEAGKLLLNRSLSIEKVAAPGEVAHFFGIGEGEQVVCLKRLREIEGKSLVYFISYFNPRIGLTGKEDYQRSLYDILEKDFQVIPTVSSERIQAMLATTKLAALLEIPRKGAVLKRVREVKDQNGRPLEFNEGYYQGHSFIYAIDIHR